MPRDRTLRKTKVIATIGPACADIETVKQMIGAGMNVARLNFSHATHDDHQRSLELVRRAAGDLGAQVAIMLDTKGFEIRTGKLASGPVSLEPGATFTLFVDPVPGGPEGVQVSYEHLPHEVRLGSSILIDDGRIELVTASLADREIRCRVVRGGELGGQKGVNVPDTALGMDALSAENLSDLRFAVEHDIDYVAASFVRNGNDVREIRSYLQTLGADIPIIAKIENKSGVQNLEEIVEEANGTMVARGDLGVEMPVQEVPLIQKRIIQMTVMAGKPVITATQMLDSMERNTLPTRAEASDVANAILDGTSAIMLSGETANGRHPVAAVRTMSSIALSAERGLRQYGHLQQIRPHPANAVTEAMAQAAITTANHLKAAAIVTLTESGFTSRQISKYRPDCPILAVTRSRDVVRKLSLNWGVTAIHYDAESAGEDLDMARFAVERAQHHGYVEAGDLIVVTAGTIHTAGSTNMVRVLTA